MIIWYVTDRGHLYSVWGPQNLSAKNERGYKLMEGSDVGYMWKWEKNLLKKVPCMFVRNRYMPLWWIGKSKKRLKNFTKKLSLVQHNTISCLPDLGSYFKTLTNRCFFNNSRTNRDKDKMKYVLESSFYFLVLTFLTFCWKMSSSYF